MREEVLTQYRIAIKQPMDLLAQLTPLLESIKSLAGTSPASLATIESTSARVILLASGVAPPEEAAAAHALIISAMQLAKNAAQIRREAVAAADMARAWDASSAAAGALMLSAKARTDIQALLRPPQLP
jgi:hypothetical protein